MFGTEQTIASLKAPEALSLPRRFFIGQPAPTGAGALTTLGERLVTSECMLEVVLSPGHCQGHTSLLDREHGILFAGDSFLHVIFTAPNGDVSGADWIRTLEQYLTLPIRTLIGTHGHIFTVNPAIPRVPFVVRRADPLRLIQDKLDFLLWAKNVISMGEAAGLPYSVIEASLFPWHRAWSLLFYSDGLLVLHCGRNECKMPDRWSGACELGGMGMYSLYPVVGVAASVNSSRRTDRAGRSASPSSAGGHR